VNAENSVIGGAIALSAETFLAVTTSNVLPQIHRINGQRRWPLIALLVGLAVSWIGRMAAG